MTVEEDILPSLTAAPVARGQHSSERGSDSQIDTPRFPEKLSPAGQLKLKKFNSMFIPTFRSRGKGGDEANST